MFISLAYQSVKDSKRVRIYQMKYGNFIYRSCDFTCKMAMKIWERKR